MDSSGLDLLVLCHDFISASEIEDSAKLHGLTVRTASSLAEADAILQQRTVRRLVVDLMVPELDPDSLMAVVRRCAAPPSVIAFGPHVSEDVLRRANAAGLDQVLTRGRFFLQLVDLLKRSA